MRQEFHCTVDDCEKLNFRRGFCTTHYTRLIKHGNLNACRDPDYIKSANFKWLQTAISGELPFTCIEWPFAKRANGYGTIFKRGRRTTVNRLVCEMAHGPEPVPGMHAAHACGNRSCINPKHISWKTVAENIADKVLHGTDARGSQIPWAKLNENAVLTIKQRINNGESRAEIAREYGVHSATICDIALGKTWRHVE